MEGNLQKSVNCRLSFPIICLLLSSLALGVEKGQRRP